MARNKQLIEKLLAEEESPSDHSLQAKALKRAVNGEVPRTLTPWEWEQWYSDNGVPQTHRNTDTRQKPWWRRWW